MNPLQTGYAMGFDQHNDIRITYVFFNFSGACDIFIGNFKLKKTYAIGFGQRNDVRIKFKR